MHIYKGAFSILFLNSAFKIGIFYKTCRNKIYYFVRMDIFCSYKIFNYLKAVSSEIKEFIVKLKLFWKLILKHSYVGKYLGKVNVAYANDAE